MGQRGIHSLRFSHVQARSRQDGLFDLPQHGARDAEAGRRGHLVPRPLQEGERQVGEDQLQVRVHPRGRRREQHSDPRAPSLGRSGRAHPGHLSGGASQPEDREGRT